MITRNSSAGQVDGVVGITPITAEAQEFMTHPVTIGARASCSDGFTELNECVYELPLCLQPSPSDRTSNDSATAEPTTVAPAAGRALRFCQQADTVVERFLCGEPTVVSNACRKPNNAFDAYVCDEPRMRALQTRV